MPPPVAAPIPYLQSEVGRARGTGAIRKPALFMRQWDVCYSPPRREDAKGDLETCGGVPMGVLSNWSDW